MLTHIKIDAFAIVSHLAVDFQKGLTVISGQTGSGKSIVFEAIKFGLGARVAKREHVILPNAEGCQVVLHFDVAGNAQAQAWLKAHDLPSGDAPIVIVRQVSFKKPAVQTVSGHSVTLSMLQDLGKHLVHIHGQNTHLAAASKDFQRRFLDQTGGLQDDVLALNTRFDAWHATQQRMRQHQSALLSEGDLGLLRHYLTELEDLSPSESDWQDINQQLNQAQHGAQITQLCQQMSESLGHPSTGVVIQLEHVLQKLTKMPEGMPGRADVETCLHEALILSQEAAHQVAGFQRAECLSSDQKRMLESRLSTYFELARKHQVKPDALHVVHADMQAQCDAHDVASDQLQQLTKTLQALEAAWCRDAATLTAQRTQAAEKLAPKIEQAMQHLGMMHARVHILIMPAKSVPQRDGGDSIDFLVTTNPDHPLKSLEQAASGGELSRISLIMRQMMTADDAAVTLAFDEAEAGVSGGIATKVGCLLRTLSASGQVLCITHLPQVAALGDCHFGVDKHVFDGKTITRFQALDRAGRIDELARMIGHETITETARRQACELLDGERVLPQTEAH